jgi:hypothetical protein
MSKIYFTDQIKIIDSGRDEWGVSDESTQTVSARVDDYQKVILDNMGKEVYGESIIHIDGSISLEYNNTIQILKRNGSAVQNPDKRYSIKKMSGLHTFKKRRMWEIII